MTLVHNVYGVLLLCWVVCAVYSVWQKALCAAYSCSKRLC